MNWVERVTSVQERMFIGHGETEIYLLCYETLLSTRDLPKKSEIVRIR